jgi:hypothetical protein
MRRPRQRKSPISLVITILALAAVGLTCRRPEPPPEPPRLYAPRRLPALPQHHPLPVPSVPPMPAHPALEELPPRTGATGSTRGTIACGAGRCFAPSEACTWVVQAGAWGCVPAGELQNTLVHYLCDDGSDCQEGATCCRTFDRSYEHVLCVASEAECGARVCAAGDGAACPAGQICVNGECAPEKPPPATCDGKKPCPKEKPICFWEDTEGECVSEERAKEIATAREGEGGISLRRCTRPADCAPGFSCCGREGDGLWMSACALRCDPVLKADYCDTDADCSTEEVPLQCRKARVSGQAEMPPWSKRCTGEAQPTPGSPPPAGAKPASAPKAAPPKAAPPKAAK